MNVKHSRLKTQLLAIVEDQPNSLSAAVAQEALDYHCITDFFSDLLRYGCQSGIIGSLIYYSYTHEFYDTHYHEIEELRCELEESLDEALKPDGELKNWYA